jgi:hypothetical protein
MVPAAGIPGLIGICDSTPEKLQKAGSEDDAGGIAAESACLGLHTCLDMRLGSRLKER